MPGGLFIAEMTTDLNTLDAPAVQPTEIVEVYNEGTTLDTLETETLQQMIRHILECGYHYLGDMALSQVCLSVSHHVSLPYHFNLFLFPLFTGRCGESRTTEG